MRKSMKNKRKIIKDDIRRSFLNIISNRIQKGKSTLIMGEIGSGKTEFLNQVRSKKLTISNVESLGSLNYTLVSVLRQRKYRFTPKMSKSVEYLKAICSIKNLVVIIDDANDLRPSIFRYIKRMMDAQIPIIMASPPEIQITLKERHEDILCRLKVLHIQPVGVKDIKKHFSQFAPDTLEVIFGASFGNMWVFYEICDECLEKIAELKLKKVTMKIVEMFI
jgi:hypothetical protein